MTNSASTDHWFIKRPILFLSTNPNSKYLQTVFSLAPCGCLLRLGYSSKIEAVQIRKQHRYTFIISRINFTATSELPGNLLLMKVSTAEDETSNALQRHEYRPLSPHAVIKIQNQCQKIWTSIFGVRPQRKDLCEHFLCRSEQALEPATGWYSVRSIPKLFVLGPREELAIFGVCKWCQLAIIIAINLQHSHMAQVFKYALHCLRQYLCLCFVTL